MISRREKKKQRTRLDLATAAVELLVSEGEEGATVAAIAARAGVSTRTFHNYFAAREDAFLYFIEITVRNWVSQVEDMPEGLAPHDLMRRAISAMCARPDNDLAAPPNLVTVGEHVAANLGPAGRERARRIFDGLQDTLIARSHGSLTELRALTLINVSLAVSGTVFEIAQRNQIPPGPQLQEMLDDAFSFVAEGYR
ncbi:TetR/AcrR family transcriptional regulator [Corynebacterium alimapuense]|uniref:TetR/AcrR family transcriptional regulator n=1 Tax=Corynebacterium alimapuense TaxID=1576874 RepID=A0A3M8KB35_9CORY|nr:TetR/AcrR family transcriptional regulator [Corynebacterium alimapuense]